jgi:hypothetical protein
MKAVSLIGMMFAISSAVSNWGGEITKNAPFVFIAIFAFTISYAIADYND